MIKLLKHGKWWYFLLIVLIGGLAYTQVTFDLMLPEKMASIVLNATTNNINESSIWDTGLWMLLYTFISLVCTISIAFLASFIGSHLSKNLRRAIYLKVDSFMMNEYNNFSISSLITRSTNDIMQIQFMVIMFLRVALMSPIMAATAVGKIINVNGMMTLIVCVAIIIIICMISLILIFITPKFKLMQKNVDNVNLVTRESLQGIRVVRAYNKEQYHEEKFGKVNKQLTKVNLFVNRGMAIFNPGMQWVISNIGLAIAFFGATMIVNGNLGDTQLHGVSLIVQLTQYSMRVFFSFMMLIFLFVFIPRGMISAKRVKEVMNTIVDIKDGIGVNSVDKKASIEFKNVSFKYPGSEKSVVSNINFQAYEGDTLAFIGGTGSGKSTIVNLIPRFFDVSSGEVLVNGYNVKDYKLCDLFNLIGYIAQKGVLFSGSIKSNLMIGKNNASEEEMITALKLSEAYDFVSSYENGLNYEIAQGGTNVSGGQRQRLCIARAIIKKPKIFIFDDSFSALDYKTDKLLRSNLSKYATESIKIIVAQRIGTILHATRIIVLEDGEIVGSGTHEELLVNCSVYKEMAKTQLSEEELYGRK